MSKPCKESLQSNVDLLVNYYSDCIKSQVTVKNLCLANADSN